MYIHVRRDLHMYMSGFYKSPLYGVILSVKYFFPHIYDGSFQILIFLHVIFRPLLP